MKLYVETSLSEYLTIFFLHNKSFLLQLLYHIYVDIDLCAYIFRKNFSSTKILEIK